MNSKRNFRLFASIALLATVALACNGGAGPTAAPIVDLPPTMIPPTEIIVEQPPVDTSGLPEWTVMMYSAADDEVLEESMWFDVNEMELVGSNPQLSIVVQMDRYDGAFTGDGDWIDARRYYITQDRDISAITSPIVENLGETDTGDPQTLIDFISWAVQSYPAQKYALIMSDHGGGWTGGFSDGGGSTYSDLSMPEIVASLEESIASTGIGQFELLAFDACLMGQIEVYGSLYPYSNYMVASEEVVPGYGLSYAAWLDQLAQDPAMDGSGLSQSIVSTYVVNDVSLTDVRAASAEEIAAEESFVTMSAIESARVPDLISAMNQFITVMASLNQTTVAEARTYTRHYESVFQEDIPPSFLDLGNFAEVLAALSGDSAVEQASVELQTAISSAIVAEKHGPNMSGSNGIAFHFPDSDLYYLTEYDDEYPLYYAEDSAKFLEQSVWDEFLAFHYTGEEFVPQEGQAFVPSSSAEVVAPGASELFIGPIEISDTEITGDETVTISTTVEGNVAYIHTVLYFYDPESDSYWVGDISYNIAGETINIDGVNFPDYGESPVEVVEEEWSPTLYTLTDGEHEAFVLLEPVEYLNAEGSTVYAVYGEYTDVQSGTPVDAMIAFDADANFLYAYAFPDDDSDGASTPVEISPQIGDQFTDYVQFISFDENDEPYYEYVLSDDVFTWGEEGFSWYASYPVDGEYAVGFIVYDFDGNFVESYEFITYKFE